jgi:hypothetical protein
MVPTPIDSYRNADNTLSGIFICPSAAIQSIESDYTIRYDFRWVTIHIGQSNIVLNTFRSHRKAHGIISTIAILPL